METENFKTISTMKKLLILFTILIAQLTSGQSLDNATINKIKAKYYGAEAFYDKKDYSNALEKINEIEVLGNGIILPTAQNLKVKVLIGLKEFLKAKKELEKLQNLSLDENIIKDIASYSDKIDIAIENNLVAERNKNTRRIELLKTAKFDGTIDGLGKVYENQKFGFINSLGDIVIPIKYSEIIKKIDSYYVLYQDVNYNINKGNDYDLYKNDKLLLENFRWFDFRSETNYKVIETHKYLGTNNNHERGYFSLNSEKWIFRYKSPYGLNFKDKIINGILYYYKSVYDADHDKVSNLDLREYIK